MIAQFHTKGGIFTVDTDTITDKELKDKFNMTREDLNNYLEACKNPLEDKINELEVRVEQLEIDISPQGPG